MGRLGETGRQVGGKVGGKGGGKQEGGLAGWQASELPLSVERYVYF